MLADLQNIISDKQSLVAGAGTVVGTNVLDLRAVGTIPQGGSPIADISRGAIPPDLMVQLTTSVTSGGAATIDFQICSSAANDLSSPTILQSTGAIAKATLVAGYQVPLGRGIDPVSQRYYGMNYVIATAAVTAGNVWAGIATTRQTTPFVTQ